MNNRNRLTFSLCLLSVIIAAAGCATVLTGTTEVLTFESNLPGIQVFHNELYVGELPRQIKVSREMISGNKNTFRFEKSGYKTIQFTAMREFNTIAILNLSSMFFWATDVISGAIMEYEPNHYHIELAPLNTTVINERQFLENFIVVNYDAIKRDAARGQGPALSSLCFLLKSAQTGTCPTAEKQAAMATARKPADLLSMFTASNSLGEN